MKMIELLLPFYLCDKDNKNIKNKIDNYDVNELNKITFGIEDIKDIELDDLILEYDATFNRKSLIEDKAKTNFVILSISITLSISFINIILGYASSITWISMLFVIVSILYLFISSIYVVKLLSSENIVHLLNCSDKKNKEKCADAIIKNNYRNLIRNNLLYTSYELIRNAFILIFVFFILITSKVKSDTFEKDEIVNITSENIIIDSEVIDFCYRKQLY